VLGGYVHAFNSVFPVRLRLSARPTASRWQAGGGFNLPIAKKLDLRLIEADYILTKLPTTPTTSERCAAVGRHCLPVWRLCASAHNSVVRGQPLLRLPRDPVSVTATAGNLDPKQNVLYSWSGAGVTGTGATASVATGSLAPGAYAVKCGVKEGKPGKEGLKPWQVANASASFTVKPFEPPTVSCSANPTRSSRARWRPSPS